MRAAWASRALTASPDGLREPRAIALRQHKPIVLTMRADVASVRLLDALFHNRNLPSVELAFIHQGETAAYMTIGLTNAHIASVHRFTEAGEEYDEVSFTYQAITFTWVAPEFITQDDWTQSVN